ncbi:MAG: SIMPL domain-containing protein [Cyclobacteriaceae bacterium]|nr:SIMPL domain-containing protein [Cyclobacteriaceae bacterium]
MKTKMTIISLTMLLVPFMGSSQQEQGMLRVQGSSTIKVKPDEAIARFSYEIIQMDYKTTVKSLGREADQLKKTLRQEGFNEENLKTVVFNVGVNRIYVKGHQQDSGYVARQVLEIKFPYKPEDLINLMNKISGSKTDPDVTFSFQLSDSEMEKVRMDLIRMAVEDARKKAGVIAGTSGTEIAGIREINYGEFSSPESPMYRMMESKAIDEPAYGGFIVQELTFSESIDITYVIKQE